MKVMSALLLGTMLATSSRSAPQEARILVGPNVLVSWEGDGVNDETLLASNPANSMNLVGTGINFWTNRSKDGQENRVYYSFDGGYDWTTVKFSEDTSRNTADPQVGFSLRGTAYFVSLAGDPSHLLFYRSDDGGKSWGKAVDVWLGCTHTGCDHPQIAVDQTAGRFAGNIYLSTLCGLDQLKLDAHICLFRSTDDGITWVGPVDVASNHDLPERRVQALNIATFADGELFLPFVDFPAQGDMRLDNGRYHYWFSTSRDGGITFSSAQKLTLKEGGEIIGPFSEYLFFAVNTSPGRFRDRIFATWLSERYSPVSGTNLAKGTKPARLLFSYSSDRGRTWSSPKAVSDLPGTSSQFGPPSIAVNNDGTVGISWYDTRDTPPGHDEDLINRYFAASIDGGETFLPAARVSSVPTDLKSNSTHLLGAAAYDTSVLFSNGFDHGEYLGLAASSDGTFHPFWSDGRTGSNQIWSATVQVERAVDNSNGQSAPQIEFVEADVTDLVQAVLEPLRPFPLSGTVELPVRLRNKSGKRIYGPLKVEVTELTPDNSLLNASNGKASVGATMDYTHALGDLDLLQPNAISEGVVWRFKVPSTFREFPRFKFNVRARIERANSGKKANAQ